MCEYLGDTNENLSEFFVLSFTLSNNWKGQFFLLWPASVTEAFLSNALYLHIFLHRTDQLL